MLILPDYSGPFLKFWLHTYTYDRTVKIFYKTVRNFAKSFITKIVRNSHVLWELSSAIIGTILTIV